MDMKLSQRVKKTKLKSKSLKKNIEKKTENRQIQERSV